MRRGFVELDGLFIHWRAIGQGPALVLLHESPRSSASLIPLMKRLSNDFCCIAFDTPGYGASDPLPEGVKSLTEFACVIRQTIASLGIETFCLYGTHTGAAIALQLAELMPERVTSLLLDGLAIFSENLLSSSLALEKAPPLGYCAMAASKWKSLPQPTRNQPLPVLLGKAILVMAQRPKCSPNSAFAWRWMIIAALRTRPACSRPPPGWGIRSCRA